MMRCLNFVFCFKTWDNVGRRKASAKRNNKQNEGDINGGKVERMCVRPAPSPRYMRGNMVLWGCCCKGGSSACGEANLPWELTRPGEVDSIRHDGEGLGCEEQMGKLKKCSSVSLSPHASLTHEWVVLACWNLSWVLDKGHSLQHAPKLLACLVHGCCHHGLPSSHCNLWFPQIFCFCEYMSPSCRILLCMAAVLPSPSSSWVDFALENRTARSMCWFKTPMHACSQLWWCSLISHVGMTAQSHMALSVSR